MASLAAACRVSARLAARKLQHDAAVRGPLENYSECPKLYRYSQTDFPHIGFRSSAAALAAQNFMMPALSPTMTEGNIASWRVKEGERFSAGDVLLEIETDKATMDVEAQEDGILMKIIQPDGSKGVQVGTRIAVVAEEGDDITKLEIPPDEGPQQLKAAAPAPAPTPAPAPASPQPQFAAPTPSPPKASTKVPARKYPLLPSVHQLIKENGLGESAVSNITPTGPGGRILKGDVLAYLGKINPNTPAQISARFEKASHLDLSNVKVAKPVEPEKPQEEKASAPAPAPRAPEPPAKAVVSLPISLSAVLEAQQRINKKLGIFLPLSTFISRATELANEELPLPTNYQPTADELFDQVLGLNKVPGYVSAAKQRATRGNYVPDIKAPIPPKAAPKPKQKKIDIIDILAAAPKAKSVKPAGPSLVPGAVTEGLNVFSLQVPKTEERRAKVFLERVKHVLENEPGRLVL